MKLLSNVKTKGEFHSNFWGRLKIFWCTMWFVKKKLFFKNVTFLLKNEIKKRNLLEKIMKRKCSSKVLLDFTRNFFLLKTCALMNKHEIFEQFEFPAQIWGFKLIPIKNIWILNFFHILSQMAAHGEDLDLEVLVITNIISY